ncbi:MAG: HEAT repeat domain-containing protein [Planctomycetota bacterium]
MKRWLTISIFATALAVVTPAVAAESDTMAKLNQALKAVATFEYGKDSGPLVLVDQIVVEAAKDARQREAVERRIVRALGSASTRDAKSFLCRQLRTIGTARSVPQLAKLLTEPELSHMARYALGRIEDPAAAAALHRALGKTSGKLQVGIVNTLANRRYRPALPNIAKLLRSSDSSVAEASARALGRIGGIQAAKALQAARPGASKALRQRIDNALLICAEQLLADGRTNEAKRIYEKFYSPEQPVHLRLAGLRGLVAAQGPEALSAIMQAAKDPDPDVRRGAIGFMTMVKGQEATKAIAALLPSLPPDAQPLVVRALGGRGDAAAAKAISAATKSQHEAVRIAALEALGEVGDASAVTVLAQAAAAADGREKLVARASLEHLRADGVDAALMRSISYGDARARAEAIRALASRGVMQAIGDLLKAAKDDDKTVRQEAIRAVGTLGSKPELSALVALAVEPKDAKDRAAIEQAIGTIFKRVEDKNTQAGSVLAVLDRAPADAKPTLLRLLGRPATAKALNGVRGALKDPNAEVRDAAVRTLSEWPDAGPAEDLLVLARTSASRTHKVLALRGYIRMAGMSGDPTAMYVRAMELAERPDDKKLVLGGLGSASSVKALELVEKYLKDKQLQAEAALAAIQIANRLRQNDPTRAKTTLKNVVAAVEDSRVRRKAQDIINEMEQHEGYILVWLASGPYSEKGKENRAIFDKAFPPEKPDARDVKWTRLTRGIGSWDINLESAFGGRDHCAAYVKTRIWSQKEQNARLEMGSDDAIKAWLNAKLVHANYANRGLTARQDLVNVKLLKGWNELLLKVVDHEGGWAFCCRVRKPDGTALEGLKVEVK